MKRKWSRVREGVILGSCLALLVLLPSCGSKGQNVGDIVIAPYVLSERDQEIVSLSQGMGKSWLFAMHAPKQYNELKCWAEVYKSGVLTEKIPVWKGYRDEKIKTWEPKLGLRINDNKQGQLSWECVFSEGTGVQSRTNNDILVPDIKVGGYGPLAEAVHLQPDEETILLSYIYNTDGVFVIDNQTFLNNSELLRSYEYVILFKCNFSQVT